jgi:hypothetical protein
LVLAEQVERRRLPGWWRLPARDRRTGAQSLRSWAWESLEERIAVGKFGGRNALPYTVNLPAAGSSCRKKVAA